MIEEIKKEIEEKSWWRDNKDGLFYNCCKVGDDRTQIIKIKELLEILDKYNNQECELTEEEMCCGEVVYVCSNCQETHQFISGEPKDNNYNYCCNCGFKVKKINNIGGEQI